MVRMRSPVQIRLSAPEKSPEYESVRDFLVAEYAKGRKPFCVAKKGDTAKAKTSQLKVVSIHFFQI